MKKVPGAGLPRAMVIHLKKRGNALYYYLNYNKTEIYISTSQRIEKSHWDIKKDQIVQKIVQFYDQKLTTFKSGILKAISLPEAREEPVTGETIRKAITNSNNPSKK